MSIRVTALVIYVLVFSVYAWRNWFVSLCSLVALMSVMEHPDMPQSIGGIHGLNPWNVLLANVFLAYLARRGSARDEGTDVPMPLLVPFLAYGAMVVIGFLRLATDPQELGELGMTYLVSEYLINSFKFILPGFLLFHACNTRQRATTGIAVVLSIYALLAVQVIRWVPIRYALGDGNLSAAANRMLRNEIGYNRVTLSMMLSGASWGIVCCIPLLKRRMLKLGAGAASLLVLLAQAMTAGRIGYVAWAAVGLILGVLRFRKFLLFAPVVAIAVLLLLPGVRSRMFSGFNPSGGVIVQRSDDYVISSGRTQVWPLVVEQISKRPLVGHGREAMTRSGLRARVWDIFPGESFPHPHNAYLECLLDNGLVGFAVAMGLFIAIIWRALRLFLTSGDPVATTVGGVALSLIVGLLVGGMGGQTFYAREGAVGMWGAIGIMLRVSADRSLASDDAMEGSGCVPLDSCDPMAEQVS